MTFASHEFRASREMGCDCDECGTGSSGITRFVSPELVALVRDKKRQRLEQRPIQRTQVRVLIQRAPDNIAALWYWTLPLGAEPLVEFGSSHRIIWVKRLPTNRMLRSIGKGIIGSRDEELSRKDLPNWIEGGVYFVPSNGGKAVGWIHHTRSNQDDSTVNADKELKGHVELIIGKVPSDKVDDDISDSWPAWVISLIEYCRHGLKQVPVSEGNSAWFYKFDEDQHTSRLKDALRQLTEPKMSEGESASANTDGTGS